MAAHRTLRLIESQLFSLVLCDPRDTIVHMAVYLITVHAYRSWMPDRPEGYVRRGAGILPTDPELAEVYNAIAIEPAVRFGDEQQQLLIDESLAASAKQSLRCHFAATDPTHIHLLLSWKTAKTSAAIRKSIKTSLTRRLNQECEHHIWFSRSGSRKRVTDEDHFNNLVQSYLPSHRS
jgi:hypothetical protein